MAICVTCGREFSGFSFGSEPATKCPECRRKAGEVASSAALAPSEGATQTPQFAVARFAIPTPVVTYVIIGINLAVYLMMCVSGASWIEPSALDALRWGADFGPLTLSGEWWRLCTSMFVHFGIIHIGFNMWCLYDLGRALEFLMGRKAFAATYMASGLAGSIVSLWWHPMDVGAGASGAIFGIAGTFAAYVFLKRVALSPQSIKRTRNSLAAFIIYNLAFGAAVGHIDNSAHVGGLIAGAILGAIVPPLHRFRVRDPRASMMEMPRDRQQEEAHANRIAWGIIFGSTLVLGAAFFWVRSTELPYVQYGQAARLIQSGHAEQGVSVLEQLFQSGAKMPLAPMLLGETLLEQGNPGEAATALQTAVSADSSDMQSVQNLALAYVGTGNSSAALDGMAKIVSLEKDQPDWDALFIRGVAEGESGNYAQASQDLEAAAKANGSLATQAHDDIERFQDLANHQAGATLPPLEIPYSKLVAKSAEWPLLP